MSERIIPTDRSVIIAADVRGSHFESLVDNTGDAEGVSAYKLGFKIGYSGLSLPRAVSYVHRHTDKKVIFDHQKAGNDIPDTGKDFAEVMQDAEVDAAIVFPFTGPNVEEAWIRELQEREIPVIVGAEMTHDNISGPLGYIKSTAFKRMFMQAVKLDVTNFVVPGNKPKRVAYYRKLFESELGAGNFDLYSPGLITQGGEISEGGRAAGSRWHGIIGRAIFAAEDQRAAAAMYGQQIQAEAA